MSTIKVTNLRHESATSNNIALDSSNNVTTANNFTAGGTIGCTGDLTITSGNLVVSSGNGIDFSATGDAGGMTSELLDDYEEGTFTPAYGGPGGTPGSAAFTSAGYYVKVGAVVTVWGLVTLTNKGSYSDTVILGSLPFTASSASSIQHLGSAWLQNITFPADESFVSRVGPNESQITFPRQPDTVDYLKISDLNNNSIMRWTVTYRTNA